MVALIRRGLLKARETVEAAALVERLSGAFPRAEVGTTEAADLRIGSTEADGLVHATPTGMADHPGLSLDPGLLHPGVWVADVVYRPLRTALLSAAAERGCTTLDVGGMAVHQAGDAFALITGLTPDPEHLTAHFRSLVAAE